MAETPYLVPAGEEKSQLTLTRSEIAFLNATIELLREEESGRTETVTITVDNPAALAKAAVKVAKKVNKWVERNGGWLAVAALAADFIGGDLASARISREQAEALERFRAAARRGVSLEELIELRDRLESQSAREVKQERERL